MTPEPVFLILAHQAPKEQKPSEPKHLRPARPYATNAPLKLPIVFTVIIEHASSDRPS